MAVKEIIVPDIGDFNEVPILEILVNRGDTVEKEQSLITLESDKATIEIPSSDAGVVQELKVNIGDTVSQGTVILTLEVIEAETKVKPAPPPPPQAVAVSQQPTPPASSRLSSAISDIRRPQNLPTPPVASIESKAFKPYAGPAVRHLARKLGADLTQVKGSGRQGRILKEDVQAFVKQVMTEGTVPGFGVQLTGSSMGIPEIPEIDFSQFGEIETRPLSRIQKLSGAHLHRSWLNIPHVTQFDEVDMTELEAFRKDLAAEAKKRNVKITLLSFLLKASAAALREFPNFNASLDASKENLILKQYCHIGVAVDTPNGLVVPVIREVDKKGLFEIAANLGKMGQKARDGKLSPSDMQGGCFTISSLGGLGGTAFTPIINAPEVAILGVSRSKMQPVYQNGEFVPRLMLPLSLSYDHRVIDGAMGVRFTQYLSFILSDVRRLLL